MDKFIVRTGFYEWTLLRVAEGQSDEDGELVAAIDGTNTGEQVAECATISELHDLCESTIDALNAEMEEKEKNEEVDEATGEIPTPLTEEECELATEALFEAWQANYDVHPMSIDEFMHYLREDFSISDDARMVIRNTLDYCFAHYGDMGFDIPELCAALAEMFSGTGITEKELARINWNGEE